MAALVAGKVSGDAVEGEVIEDDVPDKEVRLTGIGGSIEKVLEALRDPTHCSQSVT